jgi:adenine-specific DNA-methyltransferase
MNPMIWNKSVKLLVKQEDETLTEFTERLEDWYIQKQNLEYRKEKGQYFTPKRIGKFMVGLLDVFKGSKNIRILDPGAGVGIFESLLCERFRFCKSKISVSFDLYENSNEILPLLELNMKACKRSMARSGFRISYRIIRQNFILAHNIGLVNDFESWGEKKEPKYDLVICNPPYYKLKKNSAESAAMASIINGQPNIYVLFMAKAARLLKVGGQLVFLTPRSYFSGAYFKEFRKWFFDQITPLRIHVFGSRKVFKKDRVLQEMVILKGFKGQSQTSKVMISSSHNEPDRTKGLVERTAPYENVVVMRGNDVIIRVPITAIDDAIGKEIDRLPFTLAKLGLKASTGPLVPFREVEHLLNSTPRNAESAPLIWMENITDGKVIWPLVNSRKARAVRVLESTKQLTIPNSNYVMIKRFSTKEGKRRINAGILLGRWLNVKSLSIENHVNYIYKIGGEMTEDEAYGLREILNSNLYNRYFQMSNGSTQVDASSINNIPLPSLNVIATIGRLARGVGTNENLAGERLVMTTLGISPVVIDRLLENDCSS